MPYILPADRKRVDANLGIFGADWAPENAGQLNYLVSTFMQNYMDANGLNYANVNEMVGALECMKLEHYRLVATLRLLGITIWLTRKATTIDSETINDPLPQVVPTTGLPPQARAMSIAPVIDPRWTWASIS